MLKVKQLAAWLIFAIGLLTVATTVFGVWQHFTPIPIGDSWDGTLGFYVRALQHPWLAFFEQHNEHRLVFSRLIFFADVRYFGGRNLLSLVANLALASLLCLAFFKIALHHQAKTFRWTRLSLAGITMALLFSWHQQENFTWGFQNQWFAVYLFALLAFHSIDLAAESQQASSQWLALSLVSATVAALCMSSGLLVFLVVFIQAAYRRMTLRQLSVIVLTGVAVWLAYFHNWTPMPGSGSGVASLLHHPFASARYVLLYLGSPAAAALGARGADVCGLIMAFAVLFWSLRIVWKREQVITASSLLAFAIFIVLNAVATAGGRLWLGLDTALASRYTTASLAGWLAMLIFTASNCQTTARRNGAIAVMTCATLIVLFGQWIAVHSDRDEAYQRMVGGLGTREHVYDLEITRPVYPFPDRLAAIVPKVEAARISIFANGQHDYPAPPPRVAIESTCEGYVDHLAMSQTPGVYIARGWIFDESAKQVPRTLVITAPDGQPVGVGVTGGKRDDVRELLGSAARFSGWTAFFRRPSAGTVDITGLTVNGTYCALRGAPLVPAS